MNYAEVMEEKLKDFAHIHTYMYVLVFIIVVIIIR